MYVLTVKCAGTMGCSYIFELSCNINFKWQFLSFTGIAFSERNKNLRWKTSRKDSYVRNTCGWDDDTDFDLIKWDLK